MKRPFSTKIALGLDKIRNIGIIAHIDAGKTTTTERMLYYVGYTNKIGNVDQGSTVTDYLKVERERGITIQSACIPLAWRNHRINLIDTPGHVDFTIEVERSLRVLDGAVTVLDGVAGVEAQTETVWRQSNTYKIPRIIYINKLDREGVSFHNTISTIEKRLKGWGVPVICQLPVFRENDIYSTKDAHGGIFHSIIDLINMEQLDWSKDATGSVITRSEIDSALLEIAKNKRIELIEKLGDLDEYIIEKFMEADGDHSKITSRDIKEALRKTTCNGTAVPVFCGASFKNIGVQPVLDAVIDFLPSPLEVPEPSALVGKRDFIPIKRNDSKLCALAFKVIYDEKRGPLVFVRVYSGMLESRSTIKISKIYCTNMPKERATKLMEVYADDYEEIPFIQTGNIGIIVGLKNVKTGDTLVSSDDNRNMELHKINIPPPVFVRSCNINSVSEEKKFQNAIENLLLEDPSLHLTKNHETGQILLSGMGELHLEIAGERLKDVYSVETRLGKVEIAYRETIKNNMRPTKYSYDREFFRKPSKCDMEISIERDNSIDVEIDCNIQASQIYRGEQPDIQMDLKSNYSTLADIQSALSEGISNSLLMGPKLGYPVSKIRVKCEKLYLYDPTVSTHTAIRAAAYSCTQHFLKNADTELLQPVMSLKIRILSEHVGAITRDITGTRKGIVCGIDSEDDRTIITCMAPISELVGYASSLRGMTQGTGEVVMELNGYEVVNQMEENKILQQIRGY
jgi:elongation factor G